MLLVYPIYRCLMMASSNGNILSVTGLCAGNSPVTDEFPSERPVTRSFDVFFDMRLNKRLSKQPWRQWFETPSCSLWRHCNISQLARDNVQSCAIFPKVCSCKIHEYLTTTKHNKVGIVCIFIGMWRGFLKFAYQNFVFRMSVHWLAEFWFPIQHTGRRINSVCLSIIIRTVFA